MPLEKYFPSADIILNLEPEDLAIPLLKYLIDMENGNVLLNMGNFIRSEEFDRFAATKADDVRKIITESWIWLEREMMIAPNYRLSPGWVYVTKRGKELAVQNDLKKYISSNRIPVESLDPVLASKVYPLFVRGDYDTAVFQAFKLVEVRVREKASLAEEDYGVALVRKAFDVESGPLTDLAQVKMEREATSHLFAGAIGLFKNPASHRDVNWQDPKECAELIYLANLLLRLVEKHFEKNGESK